MNEAVPNLGRGFLTIKQQEIRLLFSKHETAHSFDNTKAVTIIESAFKGVQCTKFLGGEAAFSFFI